MLIGAKKRAHGARRRCRRWMPTRPPERGKHRTRRVSASATLRDTLHSRLQFSHVTGVVVPQTLDDACGIYAILFCIGYCPSFPPYFAERILNGATSSETVVALRPGMAKQTGNRRYKGERIVSPCQPGVPHPGHSITRAILKRGVTTGEALSQRASRKTSILNIAPG